MSALTFVLYSDWLGYYVFCIRLESVFFTSVRVLSKLTMSPFVVVILVISSILPVEQTRKRYVGRKLKAAALWLIKTSITVCSANHCHTLTGRQLAFSYTESGDGTG